MLEYGFLYSAYKIKYVYYDVVVLLRKFSITTIFSLYIYELQY